MTNAELADEIEQRMKDSSPVEDFAVFLASNAAAIIAALRRPESDRAYTPLHDFIEAQEELDPQNRDNLYRNIWAMYSTAACPPDIPAERQPSSDQVLVPRTELLTIASDCAANRWKNVEDRVMNLLTFAAAEAEGRTR